MQDEETFSGVNAGRAGRLRQFASRVGLALTLALAANVAHAGIIPGDSVDVAVHAPTLGEVCFLCGGVTQVTVADDDSDTVEPYLAGADWFQVDINSTSISILFNRDISWQSGDFIGLVISDIDWLEGAVRAIPGTSLVSPLLSAEQVNARLQHTDTSVAFNWQGLDFPAGARFDIALVAPGALTLPPPTQSVSEPGTLFLLFGFGFLLLYRKVVLKPVSYFRTE